MLANLKTAIVALAIGFVLGSWVSHSLHTQAGRSKATTQLVEARKTDALKVKEVAAADKKLAAEIETKSQTIQTIKKEIASYELPRKQAPPASAAAPSVERAASNRPDGVSQVAQVSPASCPPDFTVAHIRLLNAARTGALDPGFLPSDAEKQTPSSVDRAEFVQNDLDIVALYHDLAARHDQLVEEVERLQAEQRKRLGITE